MALACKTKMVEPIGDQHQASGAEKRPIHGEFVIDSYSGGIVAHYPPAAQLAYYHLRVCGPSKGSCRSLNSVGTQQLVMMPRKGSYRVEFSACQSTTECKSTGEHHFEVKNTDPNLLKIYAAHTQINQQIDAKRTKLNAVLSKLEKLYSRSGRGQLASGAKYLAKLPAIQQLDVIGGFPDAVHLATPVARDQQVLSASDPAEEQGYYLPSIDSRQDNSQNESEQVYIGAGLLIVAVATAMLAYSFKYTSLRAKIAGHLSPKTMGKGIASSPSSMLESDDLSFYAQILEEANPTVMFQDFFRKDPRSEQLTALEEGQIAADMRLSLDKYIQKYGRFPEKIIYAVNTNKIHWETLVLDTKALKDGKIDMERWDFTGKKKVSKLLKSISTVLVNNVISVYDPSSSRVVTHDQFAENLLGANGRPTAIETPEALKAAAEKIASRLKGMHGVSEVKVVEDKAEKEKAKKEKAKKEKAKKESKPKKYRIDYTLEGENLSYEVKTFHQKDLYANKKYAYIENFKILKDPVAESNLNPLTGVELGEVKAYTAGGRQATNNCGVASAWIAEQRAKSSLEEVLKKEHGGFRDYRKTMLKKLHDRETLVYIEGKERRYPYPDYSSPREKTAAVVGEPQSLRWKASLGTGVLLFASIGATAGASYLFANSLSLVEDNTRKIEDNLLEKLGRLTGEIQLLFEQYRALEVKYLIACEKNSKKTSS